MRRSLTSDAIAFASSARGARKTRRSVSNTGVRISRGLSAVGLSSNAIARAPESEEGSRHPVSPHMEPVWFRRFDWMPADLGMVCRLFGRSRRHRQYRHVDAAFGFGAVLDLAVDQREQCVVLAQA